MELEFSSTSSDDSGEDELHRHRQACFFRSVELSVTLRLESAAFSLLGQLASCPQPTRVSITHARILYVAAKAHSLLLIGRTLTKRDIYYLLPDLFGRSQRNSDDALDRLARIILAPGQRRNDLAIVASSKGLVVGPVYFELVENASQNRVSRCNLAHFGSQGAFIPVLSDRIFSLSTTARFVLVVEKETVFRVLAATKDLDMFGPFLLVTGKGYPDHATVDFLDAVQFHSSQRLPSSSLPIPILVLTDCDPHGMEIALKYIEGKINRHWLGILPTELEFINSRIPPSAVTPMTRSDKSKCSSMRKRSLTQDMESQFSALAQHQTKAEIETLTMVDPGFLIYEYLFSKLPIPNPQELP